MNGLFTVSQTGQAAEQFAHAQELFRFLGEARDSARSARWILEELARTPMELGESREYLELLDLHGRVAFSGRWVVNYSVHLPSHQVFIKRWAVTKQ